MGPALAVVRPGTLVEQWRVLNACAAAGKTMIMQAANTGLTGGSTPDGDQYHRDIVIINTDSDGFRNQKTCRIPTFGKRKLYVINADKLFGGDDVSAEEDAELKRRLLNFALDRTNFVNRERAVRLAEAV
jgi:hypothetical protein